MNYVKTETPTPRWQPSLLFAILLHLLLIGGLYYLNSENPSAIIPSSLLNLLSG